ncbi:MAG: hydrogenase/urease maturation nickel metallochaperone HypA [Candidatus Buchananbacteria bacterium]
MHDFHLADTIYKAIIEEAEKNNLKKIAKAAIELGVIVEHGEEVLPENLDFNIKMLARGGPAEGIELAITKVAGGNWILKEIEGE